MLKSIKPFFLIGYWLALTRSLLLASPWLLFSRHLAEHPPVDLSFEPFSWVTHFLAYWLLLALIEQVSPKRKRGYWFLFLLALFHGGICEYLQGFIPGRWSSWPDFLANSSGILVGWKWSFLRLKLPPRWDQIRSFLTFQKRTSPRTQAT
ncbi:MAG: hypothetical protein EBZ49_08695 [Proteobacteria bacterium]|nr:hypothetical protein [Pseudomonadota bacterium]